MTEEEMNLVVVRIAFDELGDEVGLDRLTRRAEEIKAEMLFFDLDAEALIERRRRWEEDDNRKHRDATTRWLLLVVGVTTCLIALLVIFGPRMPQ